MTSLSRFLSGIGICTLVVWTPVGARAADPSRADVLYAEGRFAEADEIYRALLLDRPGDPVLLRKRGTVALWGNRLGEAVVLLGDALEADQRDMDTVLLLAEAHARRLNYPTSAQLFRRAGRQVRGVQLEGFENQAPYTIEGPFEQVEVPFTLTDPLPVIPMRVNGSESRYFLIDTGGSDLLLDPEFAREVGADVLGSESGTFAGGQQANVEMGRVDSVRLGSVTLRNLPVDLLPTKRFSAAANGLQIDGIVGTVLLSQFQFTLDYPRGGLVLRPRGSRPPEGDVKVPFWMAGDHYMVTWVRVNDAEPVLLLIDTGLAGGGYVAAESAVEETGITVDGQSVEGVGGAGTVTVTPFVVDRLAVGEAVVRGVTGFLGVFPPGLEHRFGFRIAGILSHQFFRPFAVTFDFDQMTLTLQR